MLFRTIVQRLLPYLCLCSVIPISQVSRAGDWPMWRHDVSRSAATDERLPDEMYLQWRRELTPLTPAWPEDPRLHFDAVYQPIVAGQHMIVASSVNDSVTAYDATTGELQWRFYADGPVRFAPAALDGRIYFGADDGNFYCLEAATGKLLWKFRAAPNARKAIGNERMISVWPVRGGPVLEDDKVYFTVGVWPFEGTFLYALDARSGKPVAVTTGGDANPMVLKDRTPQGYLAISDSRLFVPCGRAVVTCLDRNSGRFQSYNYRTSAVTNYHVAVQDNWLIHGIVNYDTKTKAILPIQAREPVLTPDAMFFAANGTLTAYDLKNPQVVEGKDRRGKPTKKFVLNKLWAASPQDIFGKPPANPKAPPPLKVHIKAGSRLYGHHKNQVLAIDLPSEKTKANVSWQGEVEGTPASMLAANGKLIVVTQEGAIYCFGKDKVEPKTHALPATRAVVKTDGWSGRAKKLIERTGVTDGYCLVDGVGTGRLIEELVSQSKLHVIGIDSDEKTIAELRRRFDANRLYGTRVSLFAGSPGDLALPPYFASLVTSETDRKLTSTSVTSLFHVLRPFGGTAVLKSDDAEHELVVSLAENELAKAEVKRHEGHTSLTRVGALPGSADWTHEYGDPSNTLMSRDQLVKPPLGVLWFGGPAASGDLFYNRHYWGPSMAVIDGRMFIQGPGKLTAVDVYTGRVLWKVPLEHPENYNPGRRGNNFENKLMGFHFLAVKDSLYLVMGKDCLRFDPATGKELAWFKLPNADDDWGRIRVQGDILLASAFRKQELLGNVPKELVAMNRHTGKVLWQQEANMTFPFVAIGGNRVFTFDGALENLYKDWSRKGIIPKAGDVRELKAFDLETGKEVWTSTTDMIVTWLSYSAQHDVLVASNKSGISAWKGKDGADLWQKTAEGKGFRGHPESYWDKVILWNDRVIDQRGPGLAYDIRTGKPAQRIHPLTGKSIDWEFTKSGHHCNYAIANPHMLTFRAASAGFCDIESGNTARLAGYRSGCRNSLVPAGGVLNSPNFAHGCVCGYSLFTSLALTHLPDNEMWSYSALKAGKNAIERLGVNFGAPGDRTSSDGTLWLDYPNVGGSSPAVAVRVAGEKQRVFQRHSAFLSGGKMKWVASSGIEGVSSISMALGNSKPRAYLVRLHFAEPTKETPGERVFDVSIEDKEVLEQFDVIQEAGGANRAMIKEFVVQVTGDLDISFDPHAGQSIICGVEVIAR